MVIDMNEAQVRTLEQVRRVLAGTQVMEFQAAGGDAPRPEGRHRPDQRRAGAHEPGRPADPGRPPQRRFVLEPLAEVAPRLRVPGQASASSLCAGLRQRAQDQAVERAQHSEAWCNGLARTA